MPPKQPQAYLCFQIKLPHGSFPSPLKCIFQNFTELQSYLWNTSMDNLLKQTRVRFPRLGEESQADQYNTREGRIPPRKTISFKGERKKAQNWFQGQFSGQMRDGNDPSDGEFETAIAAVAYTITSLEEGSLDQKKPIEGLGRSPTKIKSTRENSMNKPTISRWLSDKEAKEDGRSTGEKSMRKSTTLDQRMLEDSTSDRKMPEKAMGSTPTIKKTPTFSDEYLNDTGSKRYEGKKSMRKSTTLEKRMPEDSITDRKMPEKAMGTTPTIKKTPTFSDKYLNGTRSKRYEGGQAMRAGQLEGFQYPNTTNSSKEETKADAWEKEQMAKIRKRYEKMNNTVLQWENEKKIKAKRRVDRKESEMEQRRARVLQAYRNEISRVDKVSGRARAVSDEKKRNDELKMKEKAKQIRLTGKVPHTCFCF